MNRTQRGGGGTKSEIIDDKIGGLKFSHLEYPSNKFAMFERAWGGGGPITDTEHNCGRSLTTVWLTERMN